MFGNFLTSLKFDCIAFAGGCVGLFTTSGSLTIGGLFTAGGLGVEVTIDGEGAVAAGLVLSTFGTANVEKP